MHPTHHSASQLAAFLLASVVWMTGALAQGLPKPTAPALNQHALILVASSVGAPGIDKYVTGVVNGLQQGGLKNPNIHVEYLDLYRPDTARQRQLLGELMLQKYGATGIDLVFCIQQPALNFLLEEGQKLAPQAPVFARNASLPGGGNVGQRQFVFQSSKLDYVGTLHRALSLFPQTEQVILLQGSSETDQQRQPAIDELMALWRGKLRMESTLSLSMEEIEAKVATAPKNTIILGVGITRDAKGEFFISFEAGRRIARAAKAPVFALYDTSLDTGAVGGMLSRNSDDAASAAAMAVEVLRGERTLSSLVSYADSTTTPMFDWQQLERWGADTRGLPPNTLFINRPPTLWGQYKTEVITAALLLFLSSALLVVSVVMNRRQKRTNDALQVSQAALQDSQESLAITLQSIADAVIATDAAGLVTRMNPMAERLTGWPLAEALGRPLSEVFHIVSARTRLAQVDPVALVMAHGQVVGLANHTVLLARGGQEYQITDSAAPIRDSENNIVGVVLVFSDVTERYAAQEALRIAATAFESQQGMIITNAQRVILRVNQAFSKITGYNAIEVIGRSTRLLSSGRHDRAYYAAMTQALEEQGTWEGEIWNRRKNGEVFPEWLTISAVKDNAGTVSHYVAIFSDISERIRAQTEIETLSFYDLLTNLPNRRLLLDRLEQLLHNSSRHTHRNALLLVDLDNFKTINDTSGHFQGDLLLVQVAQRLKTGVREGDTVARLGSDEFVVMLEHLSNDELEAATQAEAVANTLLQLLANDFQLDNGACRCTASIGIALFDGDTPESSDQPLKRAELAMFQAKAAGRNTLRFFDPRMQAEVSLHAALTADLREAIHQQQFLVYYQAQLMEGRMTGAEALVRWQHPQRGMVSPAAFIPLAEETGLILPIGQWVLESACEQLAAWAGQPPLAHLTIAVNVSARQFLHADFVTNVLATLARTGAAPHQLKLELTESMLVDDVESIIAKMSALKAKGVSFSLDDFGTGYSSLAYLKRLPLDQLKIDQGFIRHIVTDPNDAAIAKMVIALAQSMGLAVIAEGVELQAQSDLLAQLGCHAYQGYLFSKPLPLADFEVLARGA